MTYSVALTGTLSQTLRSHLVRPDGQEDLCFAVWYPSQGAVRTTALLSLAILPKRGERRVHGNASFVGAFLQRAIGEAVRSGGGVAFLHSHPAHGWQGMSTDDYDAEQGMAGAVYGATGLPLVGLTLGAKDATWSARFWERAAARTYAVHHCESVRVVGDVFDVSFNPELLPPPKPLDRLRRTIDAWGQNAQARLARVHVGVIGLGSVGSIISEALARSGVQRVSLLDFDTSAEHNLDRTLNAYAETTGMAKVLVAQQAARRAATAATTRFSAWEWSICEEVGYRRALDCDILFSCVDRPWPRSVMDFVAYAHGIPVIDGGILVSTTASGRLRGAHWRAHLVGPGRKCLACLGQYERGEVDSDRRGLFDDPSYIAGLPRESVHRANQNVFGFSLGAASLEFLQFLSFVVQPGACLPVGPQRYQFPAGELELEDYSTRHVCEKGCVASSLIARGDRAGPAGVGAHPAAEAARLSRLVG